MLWWDTCHTQVKGQAHWREAWASQRAGPPGSKGLWERGEVFMFYLVYSVVVMRKGKQVGAHSAWWQHTKWLLPGQTWAAVIWMAAGCCTSLTHHQPSVVVHLMMLQIHKNDASSKKNRLIQMMLPPVHFLFFNTAWSNTNDTFILVHNATDPSS